MIFCSGKRVKFQILAKNDTIFISSCKSLQAQIFVMASHKMENLNLFDTLLKLQRFRGPAL